MTLENWQTNNWIHKHQTTAGEIRGLLDSADEDLRSVAIPELGMAWKLSIAYTASLRFARIALYVSGYRPGREREHERTIDSLRFTIPEIDQNDIKLLHKIRKMRHNVNYDSMEMISDSDAKSAIKLANNLRNVVLDWLKNNYPQYL